jgi:hypothetical protein
LGKFHVFVSFSISWLLLIRLSVLLLISQPNSDLQPNVELQVKNTKNETTMMMMDTDGRAAPLSTLQTEPQRSARPGPHHHYITQYTQEIKGLQHRIIDHHRVQYSTVHTFA